jgi:hypothetical protein
MLHVACLTESTVRKCSPTMQCLQYLAIMYVYKRTLPLQSSTCCPFRSEVQCFNVQPSEVHSNCRIISPHNLQKCTLTDALFYLTTYRRASNFCTILNYNLSKCIRTVAFYPTADRMHSVCCINLSYSLQKSALTVALFYPTT